MPLEGEVLVRLSWDGHRVQKVMVKSTRPFAAPGLFAGKSPAWVVTTLPSLFSVCSCAQAAAAAAALAGAAASDDSARSAREFDLIVETIREYFWRLLIDWPRTMGREPVPEPVGVVSRLTFPQRGTLALPREQSRVQLAEALGAAAAENIYGMAASAWLGLDDFAGLQAWMDQPKTLPCALLGELLRESPRLGASDVPLMPPTPADALLEVVAPAMRRDPGFTCAPTWNGAPVETGALARMRSRPLVSAAMERCGNAVATRMLARLVELALLLEELGGRSPAARRVEPLTLAPGEGMAAVQTARGLLLHRARLVTGCVADYQIVAPTEWNFHPGGPLAHALRSLSGDDETALEQQARLIAQALDPCVACRIEVGHA
jgi:hypothetical protein